MTADSYLDRYFAMFPSAATAAGRHDLDARLEDLSPTRRGEWVAFNRRAAAGFRARLSGGGLTGDERLDAELLLRQAEQELFRFETLRRPERDPLFRSDLAANATVFLMVRDDLPRAERLASAAARVGHLPRLARQAREALAATDGSLIVPDFCRIASRQLRGSARFYAEGFARAAPGGELRRRLETAGGEAAAALGALAEQVWGLYRDVRKARGADFELRRFMDGMMELGPVAVAHYRRRMLP